MAVVTKIHKTRFHELGYTQVEKGCWQFVDLTDESRPAQVGQHYPTKAALLLNLERYAADFGCELADAPLPTPKMDALNAMMTDIAQKRFRIDTLETRNMDRLDFHDVAVWSIKDALLDAFNAGRAYGHVPDISPSNGVPDGGAIVNGLLVTPNDVGGVTIRSVPRTKHADNVSHALDILNANIVVDNRTRV